MAAGRTVVLALVAAAALSGCASSHHTRTAPPTPPAVPPAVQQGLGQRIALAPSFTGQTAKGDVAVESRQAFAAHDSNPADATQFQTEGLQGAASRHPQVPGTGDAIEAVYAFATTDGADAALAHATQGPPGVTVATFAVPGVPGAVGTELRSGSAGVGGRNAQFVVGRYEYVLGVAPTAADAPGRAALAGLARSWYDAVKALA